MSEIQKLAPKSMKLGIELHQIKKFFGPVAALKGVDLKLVPGKVHALVGENGAGKSTLMKILSGVYPANSYQGKILIDGELVEFQSPHQAESAGIAIIHQELSSFADLTVAENIFVGHWPHRAGWIDWKELRLQAEAWLKKVSAPFSANEKMRNLSTGNQQLVEIAKALARQSKVLILDEPTSSLTSGESETLFQIVRELKKQNVAIVYISHRMEEIFSLADQVTVLRDGESVLTSPIQKLSENQIISALVGRELDQMYPPRKKFESQETVLEVQNFTAKEIESNRMLGPLSFEVKRGEILGFSGLLGSGRSEILKALLGDQNYQRQGVVRYLGQNIDWNEPRKAYSDRVGWLSEDRKMEGLFLQRSLEENCNISRLSLKGILNWPSALQQRQRAEKDLQFLKTRFHSLSQHVHELSGGNQQKVLLARILQLEPQLIILDEPTRGVDVGAKFEIYQTLFDLSSRGVALLLISSDLEELLALSDRIVVMAAGKQRACLDVASSNREEVMRLAVTEKPMMNTAELHT